MTMMVLKETNPLKYLQDMNVKILKLTEWVLGEIQTINGPSNMLKANLIMSIKFILLIRATEKLVILSCFHLMIIAMMITSLFILEMMVEDSNGGKFKKFLINQAISQFKIREMELLQIVKHTYDLEIMIIDNILICLAKFTLTTETTILEVTIGELMDSRVILSRL